MGIYIIRNRKSYNSIEWSIWRSCDGIKCKRTYISITTQGIRRTTEALNDSSAIIQSSQSNSNIQHHDLTSHSPSHSHSHSHSQQSPLPSDVSRLAYEHSQLRILVAELGRSKEKLESEGKITININDDLRSALKDAERLCENLKNKNRTLQNENDILIMNSTKDYDNNHRNQGKNSNGNNETDLEVQLEQCQSELLR